MASRLASVWNSLNRLTVDRLLPSSTVFCISAFPRILEDVSSLQQGVEQSRECIEDSTGFASSVAAPCSRNSPVNRNGLLWSSGINATSWGQILDSCSRPGGSVVRCRGYAAKTKKAKSKVEEEPDSGEDIATEAKGVSVKMMDTAIDVLSREHLKLRTGRASAGMLDHITVEAHGVRTPLSHIAAVTVSGLQTLSVLPYDASMVREVEKSILNSPLGLNPQVDGVTLSVPLPRLTKEHCETLCKLAGKAGETAKLTVRRARKEALDVVKRSGNLSKDECKRFEKEVEELTKKYVKIIDEACKSKEKEITV